MSSTPGALEIVREAMDRMRTPVAVDVPPSFVFRTELPESAWREFASPSAVEIVKLRGQIAKLTEAYDVRGQALREMYEERDRALAKVAELEAQVAAFTAQNVRPLDDKPEPPAILRAIRPLRTDPRRLGLA